MRLLRNFLVKLLGCRAEQPSPSVSLPQQSEQLRQWRVVCGQLEKLLKNGGLDDLHRWCRVYAEYLRKQMSENDRTATASEAQKFQFQIAERLKHNPVQKRSQMQRVYAHYSSKKMSVFFSCLRMAKKEAANDPLFVDELAKDTGVLPFDRSPERN